MVDVMVPPESGTSKDFNNIYIVVVKEDDHTIGNFLQAMIFNLLHREKKFIDYIGYFQPHPLEQDIVFKIKLSESAPFSTIPQMFSYVLPLIMKYIENVERAWNVVANSVKPPVMAKTTDQIVKKDVKLVKGEKKEKPVVTKKPPKPKATKAT